MTTDRVTQIKNTIASYPTGNGKKCTIPPEHINSLDLLSPMAFKILKDHLHRWPVTRNPRTYLSFTWRLIEKMLNKDSEYLKALALVLQKKEIITAHDFTNTMDAVDQKIKRDRRRENVLTDRSRSHGHLRSVVLYQPIRAACIHGTMAASYII